MSVWERERVVAAAPDAGALQAAQRLAAPAHWWDSAASADGLWGRCQGSGRSPYETSIDLRSPPRYRCSCPSRKFPCKHALGLMLLWSQGHLPADEPPTWVEPWLSARAEPAVSARPRTGELADPEGAAKRAAIRAERVAGGLTELSRWVGDQIRGGLAGLERTGHRSFESMAARMVDAQAPGVAGLLRAIPVELGSDGWPARVLDRLAALHLLIEAHGRLEGLEGDLADTVRSRVGYPISKDSVLARAGVADEWIALGLVDTVEAHLETRRVWLWGADTTRWQLLRSFAPPGGQLVSEVLPGHRLRARLHPYPGAGRFRALVGERHSVEGPLRYPPPEAYAVVAERWAALVASDPWAGQLPAVVEGVVLPPTGTGPWRLRESSGLAVDLDEAGADPWCLFACSAGDPVTVFGEWRSDRFRPLSVLPTGGRTRLVIL